jgi:2-iminobutanoate/2-iminopropanoate deaminase
MKKIIATKKAPAAIGPYSQAVQAGNMIFISGQIGFVPETGLLKEGIEDQTKQVLENLKAILDEAGANMGDVVKTTIFLKDMNDFSVVNTIYASYFSDQYPARATIEVARLPKDALVEIEAVACL